MQPHHHIPPINFRGARKRMEGLGGLALGLQELGCVFRAQVPNVEQQTVGRGGILEQPPLQNLLVDVLGQLVSAFFLCLDGFVVLLLQLRLLRFPRLPHLLLVLPWGRVLLRIVAPRVLDGQPAKL
jgi:hypothetical protein